MMLGTNKNDEQSQKKTGVLNFIKRLGEKFLSLFQPEEVEVTFKVEGNKIRYTYTKVEHKQVA